MEDQAPFDALFTGGLTYRIDGPRRLLLDILRPAPASSELRPMVLFVHGGGWHEGDRGAGMHPWLNPHLVAHGFVTASVSYRLSREAHWPVPLQDVRAALRWLRAHAVEYGAHPDRLGVWGHSAGAHLAAMAALTAHGDDAVQAVALSACPADLRAEPLDNGNEVARLMGPDAGVDSLAGASPVCHVHPAAPPVMLAHGSSDEVVPIAHSIAFRDALVSAGVPVQYSPVAGATHEWADLPGPPGGAETTGTFGALALRFFREHL